MSQTWPHTIKTCTLLQLLLLKRLGRGCQMGYYFHHCFADCAQGLFSWAITIGCSFLPPLLVYCWPDVRFARWYPVSSLVSQKQLHQNGHPTSTDQSSYSSLSFFCHLYVSHLFPFKGLNMYSILSRNSEFNKVNPVLCIVPERLVTFISVELWVVGHCPDLPLQLGLPFPEILRDNRTS